MVKLSSAANLSSKKLEFALALRKRVESIYSIIIEDHKLLAHGH